MSQVCGETFVLGHVENWIFCVINVTLPEMLVISYVICFFLSVLYIKFSLLVIYETRFQLQLCNLNTSATANMC